MSNSPDVRERPVAELVFPFDYNDPEKNLELALRGTVRAGWEPSYKAVRAHREPDAFFDERPWEEQAYEYLEEARPDALITGISRIKGTAQWRLPAYGNGVFRVIHQAHKLEIPVGLLGPRSKHEKYTDSSNGDMFIQISTTRENDAVRQITDWLGSISIVDQK